MLRFLLQNLSIKMRKLLFDEERNLSEYDRIIKQRCCNLVLLEEKYVGWK